LKLINCLLLLIVISTMLGVVQAQELQYETVTEIAENSDCATCHQDDPHKIHEHTSATCQQCHGATLTDNQPECNKCHSSTIHNAPTETVQPQEYLIRIVNYMFIPVGDKVIKVGDTVTWRNFEDSKQPRYLVNENDIWAEEQYLPYMSSVSYTFNQVGMYTFHLKGREEKKINITVISVPTSTPAPAFKQYEVLGAISTTGTTFKATSTDNPAVLYYDLEDRDGYSSITFPLYDNLSTHNGISIPNGKLNYTTIPWEDYIGWGGSKYAVLYSSSSEWIITKKLVGEDENDKYILRVDDTLILPNDWSITVPQINAKGTMAWIIICKDGELVESKVIKEGGYFIYETDLGLSQESEVMNFTVETVFAGINSNLVKINNIDLISIDTLEIKNNTRNLYDGYVIKTSNSQISILNDFDIWVSRGGYAENIIGDLFSVRINEAGDMAGLVNIIKESGIHEIVGAINASNGTMLKATSADNPAVLYYDLEDKVGYESIELPFYSNLSVPKGEMNYTTISWGQNIAWGSSKYAVVYNSSSNWIISEILIEKDKDDDYLLGVGDPLVLPGGWSITVLKVDVDGDEAEMSIRKDGAEVDNKVVKAGDLFIYETDLGGLQESEVVNFTVETVFAGMNTNLVKINNLYLISTDVLTINNNDTTLYNGYIVKTNQDQLTVLNDVDIELSKGNIINVIGNLFAVKVNEAGNLCALVKEVKIDEYMSAIKYIIKDEKISEGDGYQINNYFVEVTDILAFSGDLLLDINIYQLNSDGSYNKLTTSTILVDGKRRVKYENGLIYISLQEKNLTSQYTIVDIHTSGFNVEYEKYVTGGVANAQYIPEQTPTEYIIKDEKISEGDGYQINNYFVEVTDIVAFSGDLLDINIYQLNSDGSYDELTTSTTRVDDKRRVKYQNGLILILVQEKDLTSQYTIVDISTSGFTVEYVEYVDGGVANAQYYSPEQSPYSYTMKLLQGWNLVSTPIIPDNPDVNSIFDSNEEVIVPVYTWSTTNRQYYEVSEIELGKGYWVLALNDTNVAFSGTPYSG
jgi:S-layer protein (TIGR01567 family)